MRYVSINSMPNLSTGTVMRQVTEERQALGDECWMMWGRGREAQNDHEFKFNTKSEVYLDALRTRLDGKAGFHSRHATKRLLAKLDEIQPEVVHMHNLHGYYVNVEMLFGWLAEREEVQVKWTLHDCWAFTGHCARFDRCPQLSSYPRTISEGSCAWNFEHKRAIFTQISTNRMTLVTPSHWLEGLVNQSFLSKYQIEVRYNTIDTNVFRPTRSDFRERHHIGNRFMVLGVASTWSERKGLGDFIKLAEELDPDQYAIVLVGLSSKQVQEVPKQLIGLRRTSSAWELAAAYTAADVHVQPSSEETFGMTVAEAAGCGTPVIVRSGSACVEAAVEAGARAFVIEEGFAPLKRALEKMKAEKDVF